MKNHQLECNFDLSPTELNKIPQSDARDESWLMISAGYEGALSSKL